MPEVGIVLGSGLGGLADDLDDPIAIPLPFDELVSDILKAGPHPQAQKPRLPPKPKARGASRRKKRR